MILSSENVYIKGYKEMEMAEIFYLLLIQAETG